MEDHEKCIRQSDVAFTKKLVYGSLILFVAAMVFFVWSVHIDNYIDDQIKMFEKDCQPESFRARELLMDDCNKAKVYTENARWVSYLMFCYYFVTEGFYSLLELILTNMTYIGGTVATGTLTYAIRRYVFPAGWF